MMKMFTTPALILMCCLFAAAVASAATVGGVAGKVLDQDGNPLEGAKVTMTHLDSNTVHEFTTDDDGRFVQMGMKVGNYTVQIEAEGYAPVNSGMRIGLAARSPFEAQLQKTAAAVGPAVEYKLGDQAVSEADAAVLAEAQAARDAGDSAKAMSILEKLRTQKPGLSGTYFMLADMYREQGDSAKAYELLNQATEIDPSNAKGHQALGELAESQGKMDEAIKCYEQAINLDPDMAVSYKKLGMALLSKSRFADSAASLEKYLELRPDASDAAQMQVLIKEAHKLAEKMAAVK